jgi:hypothetical protein
MNMKGGWSVGADAKGGRKEKIPKGKEGKNKVQVYVQRQHNETHQTLPERGVGSREREWEGI